MTRSVPAPTSTASACVLYEMLAGEPPFTGPTAQAVIAKRLQGPRSEDRPGAAPRCRAKWNRR